MNLPLFIAFRYLFAKKKHNVINVISAISAIGMCIGTAALILIISVFNGFNGIIDKYISDTAPDITISSAKGKSFVADGFVMDVLKSHPQVSSVSCAVEENMFIVYGKNQMVARVKGTDSPLLYRGEIPLCNVGQALAGKLHLRTSFISPMEIWYPDRKSRISLSSAAESLQNIEVYPDNLIPENAPDGDAVVIPLDKMRYLMKYTDEVSVVEVKLEDKDDQATVKAIREELGDAYVVKDRYAQNSTLYKMMKYEKMAIFAILVFVIIIIAFNIFGSLSMLIIEKEDNIRTLSNMGADRKTIRKIFTYEGWLISLMGLISGLVIGVTVAVIQYKTGFIKMPGTYTLASYPVIVKWTDIAFTSASVAVIGWIISAFSTRKIKI